MRRIVDALWLEVAAGGGGLLAYRFSRQVIRRSGIRHRVVVARLVKTPLQLAGQ